MLFKKIIDVYSVNDTKSVNKFLGQNKDFLYIKAVYI
jgi:hypothetical protein